MNNKKNVFNDTPKTQVLTIDRERDLEINRSELAKMLDFSANQATMSEWKETVLWNKDLLINIVKSKLAKVKEYENFKQENIELLFGIYHKLLQNNEALTHKYSNIIEKYKKEPLEKYVITDKKELTNANIRDNPELLHVNKETIILELQVTKPLSVFKSTSICLQAQNKPLWNAGYISKNELITKWLDIIDTPLVQMIQETVHVRELGTYLSSMILYKTIVNLYVKSAYSSSLSYVLITGPRTRSKEIGLFLLMGAPFVAGLMWTGNKIIGGKVVVNVLANTASDVTNLVSQTELEGTNSVGSSNFLFLFLNKLPSWLKAILKYLALYLIGLFIVKVIGYKSNIITEISSQFNVYLGFFLKFYCILNFLVIIYYIWKLYIIVMFSNNEEYLNPEAYPEFIKNELNESKDIAINLYLKDPGKVYKHYLKLICLYSSIVFFGLIVIVLYSINIMPQV